MEGILGDSVVPEYKDFQIPIYRRAGLVNKAKLTKTYYLRLSSTITMCRNPEVEKEIVEKEIVEKVSTFIKVDDSNFNYKCKQNDQKLERNARKILKSNPEITTEQDLAKYLLNLVLEGNCHLLKIAKLLNDKYLKLFYFHTLIQIYQPLLLNASRHLSPYLNARNHLSAYLDEVCYWQALKIYEKLRPDNYNLEKNEIFLMARAVAANPKVFKGYDFRRSSFKTFAGKVIHGKVLDELRKGREREKYSDTGLLGNISKKELKKCLNQAIYNSSKVERYLLAWQCFKEIYDDLTKQEGNRRLEPPSNEQLKDIAQRYQNRSSQQEKITSEEIDRLLTTCVQAIRQASITTIESLDAIDIEQDWKNFTQNDTIDEGEYLELRQQIQEVLVNKFLSFSDDIQKMLELKFGLNLIQKEVAVADFLRIDFTTVGRRVTKYKKELSLALSEQLSLTLSSENLNLINEYIVQFLNNYCTYKFGDFLSEIICQKSSEYNLEEQEKVKQKLQSELETYVANNYSGSLLESESVKKKIANFIEKHLYEYPYANIH